MPVPQLIFVAPVFFQPGGYVVLVCESTKSGTKQEEFGFYTKLVTIRLFVVFCELHIED